MSYVGRFAPSPSGPLHLGSLLSALGSALDASHHGGDWLLRIDDLDPQRSRAEHESTIIAQLMQHGLEPAPSAVVRQSQRTDKYRAALTKLAQRGLIFACDCSRKQRLAQAEACCEGACRTRRCDPTQSALRVDLSGLGPLSISDRNLGETFFDPQRHRDTIVWRRDNVAAYHLAVVVDDAEQGVTDVVRGADLMDSVPWQIALQSLLGLPHPRYLHLPVLTHQDGHKLSKSEHAAPLDPKDALQALRDVLRWLRQPTPPAAQTIKEIIGWSAERWNPAAFLGTRSVPIH